MEGSDTAQASSFVLTLPLIIHQLESIYPGIGQRIFNVYLWGSRVYGLANNKSDYDLLVVTHREEGPTTWNRVTHDRNFAGYDNKHLNVPHVSAAAWRLMLLEHRHEALQCYFLLQDFKLKEELLVSFEVDPDVLRWSITFASRQRFSISK